MPIFEENIHFKLPGLGSAEKDTPGSFREGTPLHKINGETEVSPFNKVSEELKEIREEPGMSNAGKYKKEGVTEYAGPHESYPINDIDRGRSALKLAYKAGPKLEKQIKENVYKKYPSLEPDNKI